MGMSSKPPGGAYRLYTSSFTSAPARRRRRHQQQDLRVVRPVCLEARPVLSAWALSRAAARQQRHRLHRFQTGSRGAAAHGNGGEIPWLPRLRRTRHGRTSRWPRTAASWRRFFGLGRAYLGNGTRNRWKLYVLRNHFSLVLPVAETVYHFYY